MEVYVSSQKHTTHPCSQNTDVSMIPFREVNKMYKTTTEKICYSLTCHDLLLVFLLFVVHVRMLECSNMKMNKEVHMEYKENHSLIISIK